MIDAKKYIEEIDKKQDKLTSLGLCGDCVHRIPVRRSAAEIFRERGISGHTSCVWGGNCIYSGVWKRNPKSRSLRRIRCIIRFKAGI